MSKLMTRLEKLTEFQKRGDAIKARMAGLQADGNALDAEVGQWLETELGLKGNHHITEILKVALETSIEPKPQIIT